MLTENTTGENGQSSASSQTRRAYSYVERLETMQALYYPHTEILNESLVKTALVLWDKVEYISPNRYDPLEHTWGTNEHLRKAVQLFGVQKIPTATEKAEVHERIQSIVENGLPDWFAFIPEDQDRRYEVMPEKFLQDTWILLQKEALARQTGGPSPLGNPDFELHPAMALLIMATLADVCAHGKRTITDRGDDYTSLLRVLAAENRASSVVPHSVEADAERLVAISLKAVNVDKVGIDVLIRLREDERKNSGGILSAVRSKYFAEVEKYLDKMKVASISAINIEDLEQKKQDIESDFDRAVMVDVNALKRELKGEGNNVILSQGLMTAILVSMSAITQTWPIALGSVGALSAALWSHKNKRDEIYQKHHMSWLYLTRPSRLYG